MRGYFYLWDQGCFRSLEVEPCAIPPKVFQSGTQRVIELPEIVCEVFLAICVYVFLRTKAVLSSVPLKQSLKQGFKSMRELPQGKRIKESRVEHRKKTKRRCSLSWCPALIWPCGTLWQITASWVGLCFVPLCQSGLQRVRGMPNLWKKGQPCAISSPHSL